MSRSEMRCNRKSGVWYGLIPSVSIKMYKNAAYLPVARPSESSGTWMKGDPLGGSGMEQSSQDEGIFAIAIVFRSSQ